MNLNHIAKKPFFDLFYRNPCMHSMLRGSLYDAFQLNTDNTFRGARGTLALSNQKALTHGHADLLFAMKEVNEILHHGNHVTVMLSAADLLQLGGIAAVEYCGGPSMVFKMGREDMESEADANASTEETSLVAMETHRNSVIVARMQASAAEL
jgi:hypothetical protein